MKLSRTIAYAVHAALQLAQAEPHVPIPCSRLAHEGQMPERFLLQILRSMVNHGLLNSTRGVDGGYCLVQLPEEITIRDIVDAFDNPLVPSVPALDGLSEEAREKLLETLRSVSCAARKELQRLTLADLLACEEASRDGARLVIEHVNDVGSSPAPDLSCGDSR